MIDTLIHAILEQVQQPQKDIEHNLRALLNEAVTKMDLVSQEEIQRQKTALDQATLRLSQLEAQLLEIQSSLAQRNTQH